MEGKGRGIPQPLGSLLYLGHQPSGVSLRRHEWPAIHPAGRGHKGGLHCRVSPVSLYSAFWRCVFLPSVQTYDTAALLTKWHRC